MKRNYTLLLFLFASVSILAQTPEKMSYQVVLRDASNTLLTNQQVGIDQYSTNHDHRVCGVYRNTNCDYEYKWFGKFRDWFWNEFR
jgi:hypothetical protein